MAQSLNWIESFPRGLDERHKPDLGSADIAENLRWDPRGVWRTSRGIFDLTTTTEEVASIFWFSQHNGAREWLLVEERDSATASTATLKYRQPHSNSAVTLETGRTFQSTPWQGTQYLAHGKWVYWANGFEEPRRWDGRRVVRMGFSMRPEAPRCAGPASGFQFSDELFADYDFPTTLGALTVGSFADSFQFYNPAQRGVGFIDTTPVASNLRFTGAAFTDGRRWASQTFGWDPAQKFGIGSFEKLGDPAEDFKDNPPPPSPFRYGYVRTFINDRGMESPPSEVTWVTGENPPAGFENAPAFLTSGPEEKILVNPKKGLYSIRVELEEAPEYVQAQRVYRTRNLSDLGKFGIAAETLAEEGLRFYLHSDHATGGKVAFVDDHPDSELGPLLDRDNVGLVPRGFKYMVHFKGTLFVAGMPEHPSRVHFSAPLFIEQFPEFNTIDVGDRDAGEITGMYATRNTLVVFKRRGIYLVQGDPVDGFRARTLTEDVGCSAPNSITEIPGQGLFFLSDEGPYLLVGALQDGENITSPAFLGAKIRQTWDERVNLGNLMNAHATLNHRDRELWVQVVADADWRTCLGMVYHYDIQEWTLREGYPISAMVETRGLKPVIFAGLYDTSGSSTLGVYTAGSIDVLGNNVESRYRTAPFRPGPRLLWKHWEVSMLDTVKDMTVRFRLDRRTEVKATDTTLRARDSEQELKGWTGSGETAVFWDAEEAWDSLDLFPHRFDIYQGLGFEVQGELVGEKLAFGMFRFGHVRSGKRIQKMSQESYA